MDWQQTPYTLPLFGAAAVSAVLAVYAWSRRSAAGALPFMGLMLAVAVWSSGYALELASANLPAKLLWARIQYLGIVTVPLAWLVLVLQYIDRAQWLTRRSLLVLGLPPLATLILVWTNGYHHLIWTSTRLDTGGPFSILVLTHGPMFRGIVAYTYLALFLGFVLLFQALFRTPRLYRRQAIVVLVSVLAPWVGNALYVLGLNPFPGLDLTPLAFTLTSLAVGWGLFRFRLLDIVPAARDAILDSMDDAVLVLDLGDRIVDLNPAGERLVGSRAARVAGRPADQALAALPALAQRCSGGFVAHEEVVLGEAETRHVYDLSRSPLRGQGGRLIGRLIVLRDISARRLVEQVVRDSERKYRTLFEASIDAIFLETLDGHVLDCNAAACEMLGYSKDELRGLTVADLVPEDVARTLPDVIAAELAQGGVRVEASNKTKDGRVVPVEVSTRLALMGAERLVVTYVRDITAHKHAEEELRASEERYRSLYSMVRLMCDNVPDMIWAKDMDNRFVFANKAMCDRMLQARDTEEPIGKTELFFAERERAAHPEDPQWHTFGEISDDSDALVMRSRQPQRFDEFGTVRGEFLFLDVYKAPFWDKQGKMIGTVGCGRIVTREKLVEQQRERTREALRRRTEQLEALRQVGLEIGAQLDIDTLLHSIVSRAADLLGGTAGALYLYRPKHDALWLVVAVGVDPAIVGLSLPRGEGLAGRVFSSGQPLVVDDYRSWDGRATGLERQNFRATVGVPVRWGDEFMGVLDVVADVEGVFSAADAELLSLFAAQAAIAIQNARLYDEARRRNRELAVLNRVIAASAAGQDIEPILETVCRELAEALDCPRGAAAVLNNEGTEIAVVAEYRADGRAPVLAQVRPMVDIPIARKLFRDRAPLVVDDARTDGRLGRIRSLIPPDRPLALLVVPLLVEGGIGGWLGVAVAGGRSFTADDADLARRVAEQVSGALARSRLVETERRLSVAVDQAAEAVMVTDAEASILYVNPAFERIVGYSRAEVIGRHPRHLGSSKLDLRFSREMWPALTGGQAWQERLDYTKRNGRVCNLDLTIAPVRDQAGEIVSFVATMRDATREAQLEAEFRQAQKMEALGRLAGGVAHDFNNLLTVVQFSAQLLEQKLPADDPRRQHVQPILETVGRATRLTRQLLSFSRREAIRPQVLSLNQVVGDLSSLLRRIIGEDIRLMTALADDLWAIKADPSQIEQVIANLAVNARDAMPAGGTLTIETANVILDGADAAGPGEAPPGEYVLLEVRDTGVGMDDEVKARIFEPFFTTKAEGQGSGLGLATVFGIVTQAAGHIKVYSQVARGTTFKVWVPRTQEAPPASEAPSRTLASVPGRLLHGTETVLVVEDDPSIQELAVSILESCGYRVLATGDGLEALLLAQLHDGPIHLLLSDVVLPYMRGSDLARQLCHARPETRVVYMSGYADGSIFEQGVRAPGVFFLPKPFTIEDLTRTVREVLDGEA